MTNERKRRRERTDWLWSILLEPRVFILEREWTTRASASIAEFFASLSKRVHSRMSVCLCERGARIHASPRIALYRYVGRKCRYIRPRGYAGYAWFGIITFLPPFLGKGINPLIQKTRRNTHIEVKEALNCWTREIEKYNWSIIVG